MCIRDSLLEQIVGDLDEEPTPEEEMPDIEKIDSVSYTHLDVYKRQ